MIDELVEKYMKKDKKDKLVDRIRKPTAPPTQPHKDKSKYKRTPKHKGESQD